jgi:acyl-CoA dehydrogenase
MGESSVVNTLLRQLLALSPVSLDQLEPWWHATADVRGRATQSIDRAFIGGVLSDRIGFAFASGYQAALQALVPDPDGRSGLISLCVTEASGNKPRDIATRLSRSGDGYVLSGTKKWATGGPLATHLLVAATTGLDAHGRNQLRMIRVAADARGVRITPSSAPFVPEIPHAEVVLDGVAVSDEDVLPGDGYTEYVKPFRTVEDVHVHGALLGYAIGVARRIGVSRETIEQMLATALAVRTVAFADPTSAATHIALAGVLAQVGHLIGELEKQWEDRHDDPERARWMRDCAIFKVASAARTARRDKAWSEL